MDKRKLTGRNLGRVYNSRLGLVCICLATAYITKRPNFKFQLKVRLFCWPKQLLGFLPMAFAFPIIIVICNLFILSVLPSIGYNSNYAM